MIKFLKRKPNVLLITGTGRSGTTILRKTMGMHPSVYYRGNENNIFVDMLSCFHHNCTYPSRKVAMELNQAAYNESVRDTIFRFLLPNSRALKRSHNYFQIYSALKPELLDYLKEIFPNIYILQIVRNGIEVISSRTKYEGFSSNSFRDHIDKWNLGIEVSKKCKDIFGDHYKLIRHDTFLDEDATRAQMQEICKWLGIDYDEKLTANIMSSKVHPTSIEDESSEASNDLKLRSERWKYWDEEHIKMFKDMASDHMEYLGYKIPF